MTIPRQPGWYEDPNDPSAQRYWDGQDWTPHRQRNPASGSAQPPATPQQPPPSPSHSPPPPPPPANEPPPPPMPAESPAASRVKSGAIKIGLVLAGLALVLAIAALVAGRVEFGTFLPGILLVAAIAIIAAFFTLRSHRSVARKATIVTAIVIVIAAAIPASLKVVYPVYNHYFGQKSGQASQAGTAGPGSGPEAPSGGAPQAPSSGAKSGILVMTGGGQSTQTYGFIDPNSGKYSEVASFTVTNIGLASGQTAVSPDFTKVAATNQGKVGWVDTSGNFTDVTPKVDTGAFGGNPPSFATVGFDGAGNFFYVETTSHGMETYKLAAGSTSNAQKISSEMLTNTNGELTYDGSMLVGCNTVVNWLGPDYSVQANGNQINKLRVSGQDSKGCPTVDSYSTATTLLPTSNTVTVTNAVGNHDGTKVAFMYSGSSMNNSEPGLYIVSADGSGQPTKVNLPNLSGQELTQMTFLKWI